MKRLLLTLLGVAALCGLSPHPATAQETNDDAPLKKTISFSRSPKGDKIYYKNPTSGEWEEKGSAAFKLAKTKAQGTEFIKVGDIIFEICKTSTCGTNVLEVATDTTRALGLYIGTKFRVYPDPEKYKMDDGSSAKTYSITLYSMGQNQTNTFPMAFFGGRNITTCFNASTEKYDISITNTAESKKIDTKNPGPRRCISFGCGTGMSADTDKWITLEKPSQKNLLYYVTGTSTFPEDGTTTNKSKTYNGNAVLAYISGVELEISTDAPNPPASPVITTNLENNKFTDGKWLSRLPITITMASQTDDYTDHTIKYIESKTQLDDVTTIDWTADNVKTYTAPFESVESAYYYARVESPYKDTTYASEVAQIATKVIHPKVISDLAELHKLENNGEIVLLDMPLLIRAHTLVYPQDNNNKYTNAVYVRDVNGVAVKLISRRAKQADPYFPINTFSPQNYGSNMSKPVLSLMKPNMVIGKYYYNDGENPVIVVRDMTSQEPEDYYPLLGTEAQVPYQDNEQEFSQFGFTDTQIKGFIGFHETDDITPDLFGKAVIVRGLTDWNSTDNSFRLSKATGEKRIAIRYGSTTKGALGAAGLGNFRWNTPSDEEINALTTTETYSMVAIVEYDPDTKTYYLAPRSGNIYAPFPTPEININDVDKHKYQEIVEADGSKAWQYTHDSKDGRIELSFNIKAPSTSETVPAFTFTIEDNNGKSIYSGTSSETSSHICSFDTRDLKFDQNTGSTTVYAYAYATNPQYNRTNEGDKLKIVIRDAVQTGPEVVSIEEFRKKIQEGTLSTDQACYVRFNGRFAVVARNGKILQLRDVDKDLPLNPANAGDTVTAFKDSYILVHDNDNWQYKYTESSRTGFPVTYAAYGGNELWNYYGRGIKVGDEIRKFIGKVTIDNAGNLDVDLTGLGNFFASSALFTHHTDSPFAGEVSVPGYVQGTPRFIPYMALRDSDGKPVTDKDGNPVMGENNCVNRSVTVALSTLEEHPDNHPEKITLTDDLLDAEMNVMKVQVAKADASDDYTAQFTADGVTLLWDMFGTDQAPSEPETEAVMALADEADDTTAGDDTAEPAKSLKEQLADHLAAGTEHFNVIGILRKHTDGKYAIQVEKLEPTPADRPARFFADGVEIKGESYEFIKRMDLTTDTPDGAVIKMTVGDGTQEAYDPEKLKGIDADTKVMIKRSTPGVLEGSPTTITLTKLSTDAGSLAEVAGGDNAKNLYHFRKHLKVVAAAEGTVMAADKEGNLAVVAAAPAEAEEGKYLADIVLVRKNAHKASIHEIDADAELLDEDESYAIATPAPATLFGVTVAEGNATDAEGNIYTIDPTFAAIPEGDAEAWKLTGYVLADDNDKPVIYLTASQAIDRVALPVITPAEAAFLDKTTVSITCDTEGAAIEYSLDGGKTWNPYTGAFDATASGEILARATADDMLPSHEAKASVVREYLSGDVTITVDEQEALTVITINGPEGAAIYYSLDGAAEKLYNGPLTLTNDTQAVINGQIKAYALESGKRPGAESVRDYQIKFKPEVTGIDGVGADQEAGSVRVEGNSIIVPEGAQTFDIAGRRVNPQGLPRGIYIVRLASGKAVKAVVK